jgi:hypothetical protein
MTDEELKKYLPAYGDRIALMAFARRDMKKSGSTKYDGTEVNTGKVTIPKFYLKVYRKRRHGYWSGIGRC